MLLYYNIMASQLIWNYEYFGVLKLWCYKIKLYNFTMLQRNDAMILQFYSLQITSLRLSTSRQNRRLSSVGVVVDVETQRRIRWSRVGVDEISRVFRTKRKAIMFTQKGSLFSFLFVFVCLLPLSRLILPPRKHIA
jgi:hypothetical protein